MSEIYNFTTCGKTGRAIATQLEVSNHYKGTLLDGNVTTDGGIQKWIVPKSGIYRIQTNGASGGKGNKCQDKDVGRGAMMSGEFRLEQGQELLILVGQRGTDHGGSSSDGTSGAGGGASTVVLVTNESEYIMVNAYSGLKITPLIIAGGGNGGKDVGFSSVGTVYHALTEVGNPPIAPATDNLAGAGFMGDGADGTLSFLKGGIGCPISYNRNGQSDSGFGGGGKNGDDGFGGGGGGYYGGRREISSTSYNIGENQTNTGGEAGNLGNGQVAITFIKGLDIYILKDNDDNNYKTYDSEMNSWTSLGLTLTEDIFKNKGMYNSNLDKLGALNPTSNPEIISFTNNLTTTNKKFKIKVLPLPQIVKQIPTIDLTGKLITNISISDSCGIGEPPPTDKEVFTSLSLPILLPDMPLPYYIIMKVNADKSLMLLNFTTQFSLLSNDLKCATQERYLEYNINNKIWTQNIDSTLGDSGEYDSDFETKYTLLCSNYNFMQLSDNSVYLKQNVGLRVETPTFNLSKIKYILSVDNGTTWKSYYNNTWIDIDVTDKSVLESKGMTKEVVESLTLKDYREGLKVNGNIKFAFYMESDEIDSVTQISSIKIHTINDIV